MWLEVRFSFSGRSRGNPFSEREFHLFIKIFFLLLDTEFTETLILFLEFIGTLEKFGLMIDVCGCRLIRLCRRVSGHKLRTGFPNYGKGL